MDETCCFDIDINFQEYISFISYELCYWLPSHIDIFTIQCITFRKLEKRNFNAVNFNLELMAQICLFITVQQS